MSTNYQSVITDFQVCQNAFQTGYWATSTNNTKGFRWEQDLGGFCYIQHDHTAELDPVYVWCLQNGTPAMRTLPMGPTRHNSNHPGGANFLFGDGSSRFIKSSVSIRTYWALGTKANSEVISSDSY